MREPFAESNIVFRYGDYWVTKRADTPNLYVCWYDHRIQRVIRKSTGFRTSDEAYGVVKNLAIENPSPLDPAEPTLMMVLIRYWIEHGQKLPSPASVRSALRYWATHFDADTRPSQLRSDDIRHFWNHLRSLDLRESTISRITAIGRASINLAKENLWIKNAIRIPNNLAEIEYAAEPIGRPLDIEELIALFRTDKPDYLQTFMMIMANTMCRTAAAMELTREQIDFNRMLVRLNPPGRRQTKKRRPVVRLTDTLAEYLQNYSSGRLVNRKGKPLGRIHGSWRSMVDRASLDEPRRVTPYSIRHSMARYLRGKRIPQDQISLFLGHRLPNGDSPTTILYAPYDPEYLSPAADCIDLLFRRVLRL